MLISEKAIGARLTTTDGKTLIFDANECMAAFTVSKIAAKEIRELRTINYLKPSELIDVKEAWFLQSDKRPSPMAANLSAYASRKEADAVEDLSRRRCVELGRSRETDPQAMVPRKDRLIAGNGCGL